MDWPSCCQWVPQVLENKGGEDLIPFLKSLRNSAVPILVKIAETFSDHTIHDVRHKDKVCEILGWVIPSLILDQMSKYEIFFLVAATYLHDIGLVDIPAIFDESAFSEWSAKQDEASSDMRREFIREFHHLRSEEYINMSFADFEISNPMEAFIIGRIARGHRSLQELNDYELYPRKFIYKNESINIGRLAYYLQVADELDLSFERAPLLVYKIFNPRNPISRLEWDKALSTSGACLDPKDSRTILVSALCRSEKVHRALVLLEGKIQRKLDLADQILNTSQSSLFPNRIRFQITSSGYESLDLKFAFDIKTMVPLLSNRIYARPHDAIRELLQNAIDACHHRSEICIRENKNYSPKIVVKLTHFKDAEILEVEDNGTGMDRHILSSYFGKIGRSFYGSSEFLADRVSFLPLSELGIGILSVFMIADKVLIETKAADSLPYNIEIFPWDEHIFVTKGSKASIGTNVRLWLKKEFEFNIAAAVAFYARHVDIPIEVEAKHKKIVVNQKWSTYKDFLTDQGYEVIDHSVPLTIKLESDKYHCLISFPSTEHPILGRTPRDVTSVVRDTTPNLVAVSRRGIFVEYLDIYELAKKWGLLASIDLDIQAAPILLSLGRNSAKRDLEFTQLITNVVDDFLVQLSSLFDDYIKSDRMVFASESLNIMSNIFNFHAFDNFSAKLKDFIANYGMLIAVSEGELEAISMSESKDDALFVTHSPYLNPHEVSELLGSLKLRKIPPSLYKKLCKLTSKSLDALKSSLSQRKFILLPKKYEFENIRRETVNSVDLSDLLLYKRVWPRIEVSPRMKGPNMLGRKADVERFVIDFVHFTNCTTNKFLLAVEARTDFKYGVFVITNRLLVNMDNEFAKAAKKVFGMDFSRAIRPLLEVLLARDYKAVLDKQRVVLEKMRSSGLRNIERLKFRREDVPSFLTRQH